MDQKRQVPFFKVLSFLLVTAFVTGCFFPNHQRVIAMCANGQWFTFTLFTLSGLLTHVRYRDYWSVGSFTSKYNEYMILRLFVYLPIYLVMMLVGGAAMLYRRGDPVDAGWEYKDSLGRWLLACTVILPCSLTWYPNASARYAPSDLATSTYGNLVFFGSMVICWSLYPLFSRFLAFSSSLEGFREGSWFRILKLAIAVVGLYFWQLAIQLLTEKPFFDDSGADGIYVDKEAIVGSVNWYVHPFYTIPRFTAGILIGEIVAQLGWDQLNLTTHPSATAQAGLQPDQRNQEADQRNQEADQRNQEADQRNQEADQRNQEPSRTDPAEEPPALEPATWKTWLKSCGVWLKKCIPEDLREDTKTLCTRRASGPFLKACLSRYLTPLLIDFHFCLAFSVWNHNPIRPDQIESPLGQGMINIAQKVLGSYLPENFGMNASAWMFLGPSVFYWITPLGLFLHWAPYASKSLTWKLLCLTPVMSVLPGRAGLIISAFSPVIMRCVTYNIFSQWQQGAGFFFYLFLVFITGIPFYVYVYQPWHLWVTLSVLDPEKSVVVPKAKTIVSPLSGPPTAASLSDATEWKPMNSLSCDCWHEDKKREKAVYDYMAQIAVPRSVAELPSWVRRVFIDSRFVEADFL